jgi:PiT family inorganic phosphate transporter
MRAGLLVGLLGFAGAVLQGAAVAGTVGTGLINGVTLTALAAAVGLLVAALLVSIGIFTGYPIPTGFTSVGAIVGAGLALGGRPAWATYQEILGTWVLIPFVGGSIAYALARLLRHDNIPERLSIPFLGGLIGAIIANMSFVVLGNRSVSVAAATVLPLATVAGVELTRLLVTLGLAAVAGVLLWWDVTSDPSRGQRHLLLGLGGLVAFSAGGSQVGLAIGPLVPLLDRLPITLLALLIGGGLGLLIGSWTGAPRMIKALSQDYSVLGPRRSIAALIPSFAIAQVAIFFGIPVSFNEIILSAIVGSGFVSGESAIDAVKMRNTALAWVGALVVSISVSYGAYTAIETVL